MTAMRSALGSRQRTFALCGAPLMFAGCSTEPGPCPQGWVRGEDNLCLYVPVDATVGSAADAADLCARTTALDGDLVIDAADWTDLGPLHCLGSVGGELSIEGLDSLGTAQWPGLTRVGGSLRIGANPSLEHVDLADLQYVGGDVAIEFNPLLRAIDVPALSFVGSDLWIYQNALGFDLDDDTHRWSVELPSLQTIGRNFYLRLNVLLEGLDAPVLERIGGLYKLTGNEQLRTFDAPELDVVGGFWISFCEELEWIVFPSLRLVRDPLFHIQESGLLGLDLPALIDVSTVEIEANTRLQALSLPQVRLIRRHINVHDNPQLQWWDLPVVQRVGGDVRFVSNRALPTSELEAWVDDVGASNIGGPVVIEDNGPN